MKKRMGRIISSVALLALCGCATLPTGPSVRVMPGQGKTFEQFQADDAVCRQWAGQQVGISPQEAANQNTATGAVAGTLIGAGLGAAVGAASGHPGAGAAIGAGSGLLVGTAAGANSGQVYGREAQRRYDNTYAQCMYAKGNQVPGMVRYQRPRRVIPPPPPDLNSVPPDYVPGNAPPPPPPQ
jgi:outer membrane lipoprotein SlyB